MKSRPMVLCLILCFVALAGGCSNAKIPLFNPDARPLNRVASGREIVTELNGKAADFVAREWITQATVDASVGPILDEAAAQLDKAEASVRKKEPIDTATLILNAVADSLKNLQSQIAAYERQHKL